ncbi:MAG: NifU family protein [Candidatus Eisenbacteria bacterium]
MDPEIKIKATPSVADPSRCAFQVDRPVFENKAFYFTRDRAQGSVLAEKILDQHGIEAVLISHDTVTAIADGYPDWRVVGREIGAAIREVLNSGQPAVSDQVLENMLPPEKIRTIVQQVLDTQINPTVAMHGGRVRLIDVQANNVFIEMGGGCQGCGMADVTLRSGVERALREFVPEIGDILDVTDHASGRNPYYQSAGR